MEPRCGKTYTSFAAAEKFGVKSVLFVSKKKALSSIQADYDTMMPDFYIDIINFEQLHNVTKTDYDLIIVDEAHSISQYPIPSERAKFLKKICEGLPIIFLSGTPTPESYSQIYHQLYISSFSPFNIYPTFYKWASAGFVEKKKKYIFNREIWDYSCANKAAIDEITKHLFISYTQEEAGFTQQVQEQVILLRMQPTTYNLVKKLITNRIFIGKGGEEILADTAVKLQNKLHQVYSGTVITEDKNGICFDHSKAQFIKEKFAGKKIAIFYKFQCERVMLIGTYGFDRLTEDPQEFNERTDKIFISQIQSGREGINLSTADALIMMNIDFSSVSYQQAKARIQTKDRTKSALLYWIFAEDGIEQKIYDRVKNKMEFTTSYFKKIYNLKKEFA